AWLNFSTSQSAKSPTGTFKKHGGHLSQGDGRFGVSCCRRNSSDGFFNNGPLQIIGDSWHQPSLFRHDSVDSGVSKGAYARITGDLSNIRGEKKEDKVEELLFEEEDFPSLNPETGKQNQPCRPTGTPSKVWENPPSAKQPSKMLVIKKVFKDPAAAFSANLVPKPVPPLSKASAWKANRMEHKSGALSSSHQESTFTDQSVIKPVVLAGGVVLSSLKESPTSTTPPIVISSSHLTKLTRGTIDRKGKLLKTLKDDRKGDFSESRECEKLKDLEDNKEGCHQNGLALPVEEEGEVLSHSLEAEHRLLKAMRWQERPENDENFLPLTKDELREFHMKTEQLIRNGFGKNGFLQSRSSSLFSPWKSACRAEFEDSDTETSSSETSDDNACK
uniref:Vasculin-like protein 1 n=1 Tax=Capra hircus TaxID=9925 RepID=A0A452EFS1_CAPHI